MTLNCNSLKCLIYTHAQPAWYTDVYSPINSDDKTEIQIVLPKITSSGNYLKVIEIKLGGVFCYE